VQKAQEKDSGIAVFHCGSAANPTISKEELARLRATKNEMEYRAEVLGEWTDSAFGLFNGLIEPNIIPAETPLDDNAEYTLGVDLAMSFSNQHDRNAVALMAKTDPENAQDGDDPHYRLLKVAAHDSASQHEVHDIIKALSNEYSIGTVYIEHYQGKALAESCQKMGLNAVLIPPTSNNQLCIFHEMHRLLRSGRLTFNSDLPDLFFDEMKAFEYRRSPNGHVSFGHPGSGQIHDDTVYAAAWALHAAQESQPDDSQIFSPSLIGFIPKQ
jgi:hypothetical protein